MTALNSDTFRNCTLLETFISGADDLTFGQYTFSGDDNITFYGKHSAENYINSVHNTYNRSYIGTDAHDAMTWSWDGYTAATLTVGCDRCDIEEQTIDAVITSEVTAPPTCTEEGVRTYTATATLIGDITYTDTKDEAISATGHHYGDPEWNWTGYTAAAADFTCIENDDIQSVDAQITSEVTLQPTASRTGIRTYTATAVFEDETYTNETTEVIPTAEPENIFAGHSLSLNGSIGVNFYVDLTQEQAQTADVSFSWFDKELKNVDLTYDDSLGLYKASCPIAIAEMTYDITATLSVGGEEIATDTSSAKQYADDILNDEGGFKDRFISAENNAGRNGTERYNALITLVQTMLDYGAKVQLRFERNTDDLANGGNDYFSGEVEFASGADNMSEYLSDCGLEYVGTSVVYLSGTTLRHYYRIVDTEKFTDEIKNGITFDGEAVTYGERNGMIYFDKKDIPASQLDTAYALEINGREYHYAALDYSALAYNADETPIGESVTKQLAAAVYRYSQAADAYFNI